MTGSPGRITFSEVMEVLFGYLVFSGLDRIFSFIANIVSNDENAKSQQVKILLQILGIVIALLILFRHKFFT